MKISFKCGPSITAIIAGHNARVLNKYREAGGKERLKVRPRGCMGPHRRRDNTESCKCTKAEFPVEGNCFTKDTIYTAGSGQREKNWPGV